MGQPKMYSHQKFDGGLLTVTKNPNANSTASYDALEVDFSVPYSFEDHYLGTLRLGIRVESFGFRV